MTGVGEAWIAPDTARPDVKRLGNIRKSDNTSIKLDISQATLESGTGRHHTLSDQTDFKYWITSKVLMAAAQK